MAKITPRVKKNAAIMLGCFFVASVLLTGRMGWLQLVQGKRLAERAQNQLVENKILQSPRGTIYDRNGRELAISNVTKSLYANPTQVKPDAPTAAKVLAPALGMPVDKLAALLSEDAGFVWIQRKMELPVAQTVAGLIKDNHLTGFDFVEENKRYYPNDTLAAHVLGFVGTDDAGLDGVELKLDSLVKGDKDKQVVETDSRGYPIFNSIFNFYPRKQGKSVALTLDSTIQFLVEQSLDQVVAKHHPQGATIIVMNPKTGEILAMASRPTYNPNQFYKYNENAMKNRAVASIYEPGSTFKAVVAAAALQEKLVTPEERFMDNGYVEVSGRRIRNWSGDAYGNISFLDIIKNSINTGFVQVGMRVGAVKLTDYVRAFGFGKATGIQLPGEEEGILFDPNNMRASDLATMSIGQSIAVTPLQLITAICAIANDGVLLKPHIVKAVYEPDGTVARLTEPEVVRQAISPDTARTLKGLLEKVISEGGGTKAKVKGYHFGGKTGTAERLRAGGGGYESGHYIASFVGFGPVEDPQIAALVVIDDPQGMYYGGEIAAPVFSELMTQIVRYLNIPPQEMDTELAKQPQHQTAAPAVPVPPANRPVPAGKAFVPALTGLTIREAGDLLARQGLSFVPIGSGTAVRQSVSANVAVDLGTEITVYFEPR